MKKTAGSFVMNSRWQGEQGGETADARQGGGRSRLCGRPLRPLERRHPQLRLSPARQQRGGRRRDAAVLVLNSAQGLNCREIAHILNISPAAASALTRARDRFARRYALIAQEVCP